MIEDCKLDDLLNFEATDPKQNEKDLWEFEKTDQKVNEN